MLASAERLINSNGQPVTPDRFEPPPLTISVVVPAVAADAVGYANVTMAGVKVGDLVVAAPTADLVAAGAGGGYINCRVSADNTVRLAFNGALAGGAVNFLFKRI